MKNDEGLKSETLKNVYQSSTVEEQREFYRGWASTYDEQTTKEFGWMGFLSAASEFEKRVADKDALILDVGCGTGLSGKALADLGYINIHGLDLSPEMLEIAEKLGVYSTLSVADLTKPIEQETKFDAVFSSGLFGFGPPHPEHLKHTIDVLAPGGIALHTVNSKGWRETNWEEKLPLAVATDDLIIEEHFEIPYIENEDITGQLLVFRASHRV